MAEMNPIFLLEEDEVLMATKPLYLSSDESEYSTAHTIPDHHHESIYHDSINQLIASQVDQRSNRGTESLFYRPTPDTYMISDDDEQLNLTPITEYPEHYTSQIPQQRNYPLQLCQHLQIIPDTPELPPPENQGQRDIFRPYDLPNPSTSALHINPPPPPIS